MFLDDTTCFRVLAARDRRFDGVFFVGVTTTGIYCRPVCPARTPGRARCRFFALAAAAERQGFRPCLRCRPELAPGQAPVDAVPRLARIAAGRIEAGALNNGSGLEGLAEDLGISSRQLRRAVRCEFGVSPIELAQTRRLLLAKQLLTETRLPIIEVALASGFESLRRFNALFLSRYRMAPSRLRRAACSGDCDGTSIRLVLAYRPPYAWQSMLKFLAARATAGVECVQGAAYLRTVEINGRRGWLRVARHNEQAALAVTLSGELLPVLPQVLARVRAMVDLDARPNVIAAHLRRGPALAPLVRRLPGLRVPGAFDGFELTVRAILGQRISIKAATTLAGRLAERYGEPVPIKTITPAFSQRERGQELQRLLRFAPAAERLAAARAKELAGLGIGKAQAQSIVAVAQAVVGGGLQLCNSANPQAMIEQLQEMPGIGEWTAQYVALRALRWPDAFPAGDLGLLKASGAKSPRGLLRAAEAWRPWRAYAAMHLWNSPTST